MRFNVYRRAVAADKYFRSRQAALNSTVRVGADVLHGFLPYCKKDPTSRAKPTLFETC